MLYLRMPTHECRMNDGIMKNHFINFTFYRLTVKPDPPPAGPELQQEWGGHPSPAQRGRQGRARCRGRQHSRCGQGSPWRWRPATSITRREQTRRRHLRAESGPPRIRVLKSRLQDLSVTGFGDRILKTRCRGNEAAGQALVHCEWRPCKEDEDTQTHRGRPCEGAGRRRPASDTHGGARGGPRGPPSPL